MPQWFHCLNCLCLPLQSHSGCVINKKLLTVLHPFRIACTFLSSKFSIKVPKLRFSANKPYTNCWREFHYFDNNTWLVFCLKSKTIRCLFTVLNLFRNDLYFTFDNSNVSLRSADVIVLMKNDPTKNLSKWNVDNVSIWSGNVYACVYMFLIEI